MSEEDGNNTHSGRTDEVPDDGSGISVHTDRQTPPQPLDPADRTVPMDCVVEGARRGEKDDNGVNGLDENHMDR